MSMTKSTAPHAPAQTPNIARESPTSTVIHLPAALPPERATIEAMVEALAVEAHNQTVRAHNLQHPTSPWREVRRLRLTTVQHAKNIGIETMFSKANWTQRAGTAVRVNWLEPEE